MFHMVNLFIVLIPFIFLPFLLSWFIRFGSCLLGCARPSGVEEPGAPVLQIHICTSFHTVHFDPLLLLRGMSANLSSFWLCSISKQTSAVQKPVWVSLVLRGRPEGCAMFVELHGVWVRAGACQSR